MGGHCRKVDHIKNNPSAMPGLFFLKAKGYRQQRRYPIYQERLQLCNPQLVYTSCMKNVWPPYPTRRERMHWYYTVYLKTNGWITRRSTFLDRFPECAFKTKGICTGHARLAHHTPEGYEHLGFEDTRSFNHLVPACSACHQDHHNHEWRAKKMHKVAKGLRSLLRLIWLP